MPPQAKHISAMNFPFNFPFPWFLGDGFEVLIEFGIALAALTSGVYALKRIMIAWRDRGAPARVTFISRGDLLDEGLPILSLSDGKKVGKAKDVILDLSSGRIAGFRAKSGPFTHRILPFDRVKAIGPDAITVESAASLLDPEATPALLALARKKYRNEDCRVMTESGTQIGDLSWRHLRFDAVTGEAQIVLKFPSSSFTTYLIDLLFDVVSILEPLEMWSDNPWRLELRLPLNAVLNANLSLVIVSAQAEADCKEQQQAMVSKQRERLKQSRDRFRLSMLRLWRFVTGKTQ